MSREKVFSVVAIVIAGFALFEKYSFWHALIAAIIGGLIVYYGYEWQDKRRK